MTQPGQPGHVGAMESGLLQVHEVETQDASIFICVEEPLTPLA